MKKKGRFIQGLSVLLLGFANPLYPAPETAPEIHIKVGIYAPFSEDLAFIGRTILNAMEEGCEQRACATVHYTFFTLDQTAKVENLKHTLQRFTQTHQIQVLLTEGIQEEAVIAAFAKEQQLIHFNIDQRRNLPETQITSAFKQDLSRQLNQATAQVFELLHHSVVQVINTKQPYSNEALSKQIHRLAASRKLQSAHVTV